MANWKTYHENSRMKEDKDYFVRWINYDGEPQTPVIAYWIEKENSFFMKDDSFFWPIRVDEYMEIEE